MSPMMGDTPSGVVARRTCPSGVAFFGRVTHAPADSKARTEDTAINITFVWGGAREPQRAGAGLRREGRRCSVVQFLDKVVDAPVVVLVFDSVEVPLLLFVGVQFLDKVADLPVVAFRSCTLRGVAWWRRCRKLWGSSVKVHRWVVQFLDKDVDVPVVCNVAGLIVVCQRRRSWTSWR